MSSHHFVKDKQEPLLIVQSIDQHVINPFLDLLEWNPEILLFNTENNRNWIEAYDIYPDWIFYPEENRIKHSTDNRNIETTLSDPDHLSHLLSYNSYNLIDAISLETYCKEGQNWKQLTKAVIQTGVAQNLHRRLKKWYSENSEIFIPQQELKCLNIDLHTKNSIFAVQRTKDGFHLKFKRDFLLEIKSEEDFRIIELF